MNRTRKEGFTLIELLVVIAIIAILAAILFPVFSRAKEAAKKTVSISQMRQLAAAVMMYSSDYDDYFPPASLRTTDPTIDPIVWPSLTEPYIKNDGILVAAGSDGVASYTWATRRTQSVGYSDATGYDPNSSAIPGSAPAGTEGFASAVNFSVVEETAKTGLFVTTPNGPKGDVTSKHRGYVFNPYNGMNSPDGNYSKGLPMISDRDLIVEFGDPNYPNSPNLGAGALKPVYCRYFKDGSNSGTTPVIFADGHTKSYSANSLNAFGTVIWRFR